MLSDRDGAEFVAQMQEYLTQIRAIPKAVSLEHAIRQYFGRILQRPLHLRLKSRRAFRGRGSFQPGPAKPGYPDDPSRRGHKAVFTHADLNSRNILADRIIRPDGTGGWTVTGIVDWENSGYYPEYWDYTKAFFEGFRHFMHEIFKPFGNFLKEFEIDKRGWEEGDYI